LAVSTHIKTNNSGVNGQSDCYIDAGKYKDSTGNFDISPSCNW
jgi:hypothetical protein